MPAAKKRKVTTTEIKNRPSSARPITAFTKVSKSYVVSKYKEDKSEHLKTAKVVELDRKRKISSLNNDKSDEEAGQASTILRAIINQPERDIKHLSHRLSDKAVPKTPNNSRPLLLASNSSDTPTKGPLNLFDELLTSSSQTKQESPPLSSQQSINKDFTSSFDQSIIEHQNTLPTELTDLIDLHSSFLTALTLHHAHNGPHSPADLRMLCPDVARAWGKRKVLLADIQRILGVLNSASSWNDKAQEGLLAQISLSDYGHGKICVEVKRKQPRGRNTARPLNEKNLNDAFAFNLRALWGERRNTGCDSILRFIELLPKESIKICSSLAKMSPLLAKGQRRLEDLRAGITVKRESERECPGTASAKGEEAPQLTLLERIRAKQLRQANLPPPPSKENLSRQAALSRLEEVIAILTVLTTSTSIGQERISLTIATVLGKLKDSFRTPISKDEGETCVRLLALEIAPEWLQIVKIGKFDAVVVNRNNRPSDLDIQERIKSAG